MADALSKRRRAYGVVTLIVVGMLTAFSAGVAADTTPPDKELTELKARVERLEKQAVAQPAPPEAWLAIGGVGALFVIAWLIVSWRREESRIREAAIHERIAIASAQTKANDAEVRARLAAVVAVLNATREKSNE